MGGELPAVGALGFQLLFGAFGTAAFGGGERGDGRQLSVVLFAEGVAFAGGVGADVLGFGAGVGFGLPGAGGPGVSAAGRLDRIVTFAACLRGLGPGAGDLGCGFFVRPADLPGRFGPGPLERVRCGSSLFHCRCLGGLGGAGILACGVEGFGQGLGFGSGFGGAGFGGDGGGFGAAPGGFGLGDLRPDPGGVQAGGLLAGSAGEHGPLPQQRVEGGERIGGAVRRWRRCRDGGPGVVVVAAGAFGAAELPGAAACPRTT